MIDKEVLVFSAARTGSTLIWQCLSKIFKTVHKSHDGKASPFFNRKVPCVITERDRVESFLSRGRILRFKKVSAKEFVDTLDADLTNSFALPSCGLHQDVIDYRLELHTVEYLKSHYKGKKLIYSTKSFLIIMIIFLINLKAFLNLPFPLKLKT